MHRTRQFAKRLTASVFTVRLLADVPIQTGKISACAPACARRARGDGAEVVAQPVVDGRVVEAARCRVVLVAGEIEFVAELLFRHALGESRAVLRLHWWHVDV